MSLPSIVSKGSSPYLASDDSPYVFEIPDHTNLSKVMREMLPLPQELWKVSVPLPGSAIEGYSSIYRNGAFPNRLKEAVHPDLNTLHALFMNTVSASGNSPYLSYRKYDYDTKVSETTPTTISYNEVQRRKLNYGSGLLYLLQNNPYRQPHVYPSHGKIDNHLRDYATYDKDNISFIISILSPNRYEWVLTDVMSSSYSITNTALYDTLGPESSKYILELTESPVTVASKDQIKDIILLKQKNPQALGTLISIISFDPLFDTFEDIELKGLATKNNIALYDLDQVMKIGEIFPLKELPPNPDTIHTISFTSGTTGANPKGVVLSQRTSCAGITFCLAQIPQQENSKMFCFLPLTHIYERQTSWAGTSFGACVCFPQQNGSPLTLVEDLKIFKPTSMSNVPRVYTKFEAALKAATVDSHSVVTAAITKKAIAAKIARQSARDGDPGAHLLYDNTLISKLRSSLGFDEMAYCITGSAPISPSTIKFMKAALNIGICQGYGLTESFAGMSMTIPYEANPGSCGSTGICVEMRVRELPEMGYHLKDKDGPRGELQLRGPQIFTCYFKNEEETKKALDQDGWFSTGDVAQISNSNGQLKIIDRVKNFFKLSQGEYVTPEKVENIYLSNNSLMTQCYAHGDSFQSFLVGIIGVDPVGIKRFLTKQCNVSPLKLSTNEDILKAINRPQNKSKLLNFLNSNVNKKVQGYERLHNIHIEFEPLTIARNVVTPTQKLKRPIASKFFAEQFTAMYDEGSLIKRSKL